MYRIFQQDLIRLKLLTGKEFLKSVQAGLNPVAKTKTEAIRINAEVHGLGPRFKLTVKLQNTSLNASSPIVDLYLSFTYDENIYKLNPNYVEVRYWQLFSLSLSLSRAEKRDYLNKWRRETRKWHASLSLC